MSHFRDGNYGNCSILVGDYYCFVSAPQRCKTCGYMGKLYEENCCLYVCAACVIMAQLHSALEYINHR